VNPTAGRDFFISYTAVNRTWAEWIAVQLEAAGYSTVLQSFDFRPGSDFVHEMHQATDSAERTIAVLSPAYFASEFSESEWRASFADDPSGEQRLLVPVRVQPCKPPGLLKTRVYVDLVDVDELTCRQRLLDAVRKDWVRRQDAEFPGAAGTANQRSPRFPGSGPAVTNLLARNRNFSGRGHLLDQIHADLQAGSAAAVLPTEAVHGLGGVGKTELVLEYAHRFGSDYDIIWWIPAEQPSAAGAALAALAGRLGIAQQDDRSQMVGSLFDVLRGRDRWLLVYDNAERPAQLSGLLPLDGLGHVLVTSRWSAWGQLASPLRLGVLSRIESVDFLQRRTRMTNPTEFDSVAELLGDLPLALEEAAAYLEETGDSARNYLILLRDRSRELFGLHQPSKDEHTDRRLVATAWSLALDRASEEAPASEDLLNLCAFLAPEIPRDLPTEHPGVFKGDLAVVVSEQLAYNRALAAIGRYSLATVTPMTVVVHRLVQAVIQARLGEEGERAWAKVAGSLLRSAFPVDSSQVETWPECERLLPSVLVATGHEERLGLADLDTASMLDLAATYLRGRGQYRQALIEFNRAREITEAAVGPDHPDMSTRHGHLGLVLRDLGDLQGARKQLERALQITEGTFGPDHLDMGIWRGNLGLVLQDLADLQGAREEVERALQITEAALGPDHATVGIRCSYYGLVLHALGDLGGAREQLDRALRITEAALGPDHPDMGNRRGNLGLVLRDLGDRNGAREQLERALQITEAALGPDHPDVGVRCSNLGLVLRDLGDRNGAREQLERALQITEAALGPDHPNVAVCWRQLQSLNLNGGADQ